MNKASETVWSENHPKSTRAQSKRRGPRMNCRVPVAIAWNLGSCGFRHRETGFTRVVNTYGCLLVSPEAIDLQQQLRLTNLMTLGEADAEVVWTGTRRPDGWDLGVKLIDAEMDFWGLDF
jgi:hypothetical protein